VTAYYIVEEPDDLFIDDFGNDDAPAVKTQPPFELYADWWEEPDELFVDDFGNDSLAHPKAPTGIQVTLH
jgi:hypothetical protein